MRSRLGLVADSTILFDLSRGGIVEAAFTLPADWLTVDVVAAELLQPPLALFTEAGLQVAELTGPQVAEVAGLAARYPRPSRADLFALVLAKSRSLTLLTGDAALRQVAEAHGISVHGTLWILDRLVADGILSSGEAADALERMQAAGSRLPSEEARIRLQRWRLQTD